MEQHNTESRSPGYCGDQNNPTRWDYLPICEKEISILFEPLYIWVSCASYVVYILTNRMKEEIPTKRKYQWLTNV